MGKTIADIARAALLIGIGSLIFIAPIKFGMPVDSDIHWILDIGIIIFFTLWLISSVVTGGIRIRYSALDFFILIFLITAGISTLRAPDMHRAGLCLTRYFSYALIYFLVLNILRDEKDLRFLFGILIIPGVLISLYGIYQYHIGLPETREFASQYFGEGLSEYVKDRLASNRVFSTFIYPNTLAGYLFLCIPLMIWIKNKMIRIIAIFILIYCLSLTFYRGSGSIDKVKNTLAYRLENWTAGVRMIKEHPITGVGLYNFSVFYPLCKLDIAEEVQNAHNNFLQVWAEQGIFGLLAFCLIWLIAIKNGFHRGLFGLSIGLIAFVIHNLVDFDWYVPGLTIIAWVFVGIIVWNSKSYKEKVFQIRKGWHKALCLLIMSVFFMPVLIHLERNLIADYDLRKASEAFSNKNYPLAEVLCKVSIKMDKGNPKPYFLLGRIYVYKMDYLNSITWFKKALEYNPYSSAFYYHLGLSYVYVRGGASNITALNILEAFKKAVEYYPTNPFYHLQLAQFYETNGQSESAIKEYRYCLELNDKIEKECETSGKMLRHLILPKGVVGEVRKKIPTKFTHE